MILATYRVEHSCGHVRRVRLAPPVREHERILAGYRARPCGRCRRAEQRKS